MFEYAANVLKEGVEKVEWFPEYGCLIIEHDIFDHVADTVALRVLGLDEHQFELHGGRNCSVYDHTSRATDFVDLYVGLAVKDNDVIQKFQNIYAIASQRTGDKRSGRRGNQGHQKTPAFIHALTRQAYACKCENKCGCFEEAPNGGFTDCGLHTGGLPRDTR